ncbi:MULTISPECIES: hypothetical protein [unclassified Micromonospora]|uniref:hypothetical protein n=1 Tax=unclassified Micromonospora TaxID=2617518 RepID=UPI002FF355FF
MQPEGPYRFTEVMGECQVGRAWAALDAQDRPLTVVVLDGPAADDSAWREAFTNAANLLHQTAGGHRYVDADFTAAQPWVSYPVEEANAATRLFQTLGMDYQSVPVGSADGGTQPSSGAPQPSWTPQPWSMTTGQPVSGAPMSGAPTSGTPMSGAPMSGAPMSPAADPAPSYDAFSETGRRIAPVPAPPKRRTWLWALLAVVLFVAGGGIGFGWGRSTAGGEAKPAPSPSLSPYEASQFSVNKAKFDGSLAVLAEPWLARMGGCASDTEVGGPKLPEDEKQHVFCRYGGLSVHFALYESGTREDAARAYRQQLAISGSALAPGLRESTRTKGGVTGVEGSYVEYAFKAGDGRPTCGIWWDRDDSVGAVYFETLCEAGVAGNWDALRDVWHRHS